MLLILQPPATGVGQDICIDMLTGHPPELANLVVITYEHAPDEWLATWRQQIGEPPPNLTLITTDATQRSAVQSSPPSPDRSVEEPEVLALSDPGNLTQLGLLVSERLTDWQATAHRTVVCGGSLTAMLQWVDLPILFRFLHVFLTDLRAANAHGHFHLNPAAHTDQTRRTLEPLFDQVLAQPLNRSRREQPAALDMDALRDLLGVPDRRHILRILLEEESITVDELATRVVDGKSTADTSSDHLRDRTRITLHHTHLPKLDGAGLINYDNAHHTVQLTAHDHHVRAYLDRIDAQSGGGPVHDDGSVSDDGPVNDGTHDSQRVDSRPRRDLDGSLIAKLWVAPREFELGRIMALPFGVAVELETLVPAGEAPIPFFWLYGEDRQRVVDAVRAHPSVERLVERDSFDDCGLYELAWTVERDLLFDGVRRTDGHVVSGTGTADAWQFDLRFASPDALAAFQRHCTNANLEIDIRRVATPTRPEAGPWFGLTERQRETLVHAVRAGYYDIPRTCRTADLAAAFDISSQAVSERLRRGIRALVTTTLMVDQTDK